MYWFGKSWGAPVNEDCPKLSYQPTGAECMRCGVAVAWRDDGFAVPYVTSDGHPSEARPRVELTFYHRWCWLAEIVGQELADVVERQVIARQAPDSA